MYIQQGYYQCPIWSIYSVAGGLGGLSPRRLMTGPLPKDGVDFRPVPVGRQVGTKTDLNINIYLYAGLFLHTKLGPVSGTKFFPNWLKKFSIDLEHSQLAEKSQIKRLTFPILLKIALFFPKIVVYFPKITQFFPNIIGTKNFPKRSEKALICIAIYLNRCRPADLPAYRHWSEVNAIFW